MCLGAKSYNKILLHLIRDPIYSILRANQAGFRRNRSCTDQVHILRRLIESFNNKNLAFNIMFLDFKKPFDSIKRSVMFKIFRHYGMPEKIVRAIQAIYNKSKSVVLVEGKKSEDFEVKTGVLQEDTLVLFLFIIVMDYVLRETEKEHRRNGDLGLITNERQSKRQSATSIIDLDFADDLVKAPSKNHSSYYPY